MTTFQIKKLYSRYFQKSKSFLVPALGLRKITPFPFTQSYLTWDGHYELKDYNLILRYESSRGPSWDKYLLETIMANSMFNEYHELQDGSVAISFDLHSYKTDYELVTLGKYSGISSELKSKIRLYYGYNSPEWGYMESFLFPKKYFTMYAKALDVDEKFLRQIGELCDKPSLTQEKLKINAKHNDVDSINMEQREDFQIDPDALGLSLQ
jgi:hypothetical protein